MFWFDLSIVELFRGRIQTHSMIKLIAELSALVAYFAIGIKLTVAAERQLVDPSTSDWVTPLLDASRFTEEGKRLRKRALLFWDLGLVVIVVYWLAV